MSESRGPETSEPTETSGEDRVHTVDEGDDDRDPMMWKGAKGVGTGEESSGKWVERDR